MSIEAHISGNAPFEAEVRPGILHERLSAIRDSGLLGKMSEADIKVLFVLATRAKSVGCDCWPSIASLQRDTGLSHGAVTAAIVRLNALCVEMGKRRVRGRVVNQYEIVAPKRGAYLIKRSPRPNNLRSTPSGRMEGSIAVDESSRMDAIHTEASCAVHTGGLEVRSSSANLNFELRESAGETAKGPASQPESAGLADWIRRGVDKYDGNVCPSKNAT